MNNSIYRGYDLKAETGPIAGLPVTIYDPQGRVAGEANSEDEAMAMVDAMKREARAQAAQ